MYTRRLTSEPSGTTIELRLVHQSTEPSNPMQLHRNVILRFMC